MQPNILLIVIDTARADIVHQMMENGELPSLQELAEEGLQFTNAISPSPWTLPSHASIFTGQRASDHNAHAGNKYFNPDTPPLAEHLQTQGYQTYGISGNIWISPEFGFDRGFDNLSMKYDRFWNGEDLSGISELDSFREKLQEFTKVVDKDTILPTLANGIYTKLQLGYTDKGASNTTRRTRKWIQRHKDDRDPFFYFINYLEPHLKYNPKKKYVRPYLPSEHNYEDAIEIEQDAWGYIAGDVQYTDTEFDLLEALYQGELAYIDHQIGKILDELSNQDLREKTNIIVLGDHGENIGDHKLMDHQYCLYQTLVHVPLLISGPLIEPGEVSAPIETRDVFPTIHDIAELEIPQHPTISNNTLIEDPDRTFAISEYLAPQPSMESLKEQVGDTIKREQDLDRTFRAIQNDSWKLIEDSDGNTELYNIVNDPSERSNHAENNLDIKEKLHEELNRRDIPLTYQSSQDYSASEASRQRLEDLGYI